MLRTVLDVGASVTVELWIIVIVDSIVDVFVAVMTAITELLYGELVRTADELSLVLMLVPFDAVVRTDELFWTLGDVNAEV